MLHKFIEKIPRAQIKIIDLVHFTECIETLVKIYMFNQMSEYFAPFFTKFR